MKSNQLFLLLICVLFLLQARPVEAMSVHTVIFVSVVVYYNRSYIKTYWKEILAGTSLYLATGLFKKSVAKSITKPQKEQIEDDFFMPDMFLLPD